MNAEERTPSNEGMFRKSRARLGRVIESAVSAAIGRGFVVGREVLVGRIPGIIVGYNIGSYGQFVGNAYPLVVRTSLGVTKCNPDELSLA